MWERNLNQRLILVGAVLVCGILLIIPPNEKLRGGLDITGGVSLIFEIDDTGMEDAPNLAEDMKTLLQKRVDPDGVYDLTWRVHGRNRLEVQMPLPPEGVTEQRREYFTAQEDLFKRNIKRGDLERAFRQSGAQREAAIQELARGLPEREDLLHKAAAAYDAYTVALAADRQGPVTPPPATQSAEPVADAATQPTTAATATTQPTSAPAAEPEPPKTMEELESELRDAEELLDDAYDAFLATNLDRDRFLQILEMDPNSQIRRDSLDEFKLKHPDLADQINALVQANAEWRENRGYLDGPADLQRLLRGAGVLDFRILPVTSPERQAEFDRYRRQLQERGPRPLPDDDLGWFKIDNPLAFFNTTRPADLDKDVRESRYVAEKLGNDYYVLAKLGLGDRLLGRDKSWQLRHAARDRDSRGAWCVIFELDVVGGGLFEELTGKNIDQPLCILVDDVAYSAPNIKDKIRMRGTITGDFSIEKVDYLVQTMQAGSLPARLKETPISERTIGSSLGATNRDMAFRAGLIGVIVVALFMAGYYLVSGMIANAALLMNIILVLAVMAMLEARFTLAGMAGVILTIGMSVDANVLIFERMREERQRGSSLRLIIKNGYEKAFSTIIDANITTLLTCVILYYVGSEEIKGFGLVLGWGIVISMFTALFATRTVFTLLVKYGLIKDVRMFRFMGVPKWDWYGKRKFFIPLSLTVIVAGLGVLVTRGWDNLLDVEFLGGLSVEIEVEQPEGQSGEVEPLDDVKIAALLEEVGASIVADADKLAQVELTPVVGRIDTYRVRVPGVSAERLAAIITEPLEDRNWLPRGGIERSGEAETITVRLQSGVGREQLQTFVGGLAEPLKASGNNIARANVGSVIEAVFDQEGPGRFWNITTTEKNRRLVQHALEAALGDRLRRQQRVGYVLRGDASGRPFPVLDRRLENVIHHPSFPTGVGAEPLIDFLGGVAIYFDELDPPQSIDPKQPGSLADRLRNMRLQPGYQDLPYREFKLIGVQTAGEDQEGRPLYSSVVMVLADENYRYSDDPERWYSGFAQMESEVARAALDTEQALRRVSQFKPQIARQATQQACMALLLSWAMIIGYLWVRFGRPVYGLAGVVALVHDVCIALALVGFSHWIGGSGHPLGAALLIDDFKIDMTIVAAFLTIIGYSINDTIVVFDRIRETRGRLGRVTPDVINASINQCMSRTLLTSATTFVILLIMYVFGGASIRGFNFCMMVGVLTGTYSSIAVAAPLLMIQLGGGRKSA